MKNALRHQLREQRQALSPASHAEKSEKIRRTLEELREYKEAEKVLFYVSHHEEVDTHSLIKDALASGRKVYAPKITNGSIVICPLNEWKDLEPGTFGILEPCKILEETHPQEIDLIVIPGVGFDRRGHRIGYGKGHYDKLLKTTRGFKVGLAFHEQIIDEVPTEAHDVPLDLIITDQTLIHPSLHEVQH